MPDTNELVLAAQGGDERAFTQLMLRHSGYVRNIALRYRIIEGEIDDVLQLVFEKVWQRLSDFRGDASFLTWLYRIAVNMCIDHIRKAKRKAECEYDDTVEQSRDTSAHVYSQNERLWAEEATVAIDSAVAGLTAAHAQILTLSLVEGLSHEEIAHHLGIPRGTVMSRLFHARHNTQRALLEKGIIPHSSTQEVGRREVDVASAKKSDRLDDLLRFRSPPERNADALGVALFLLRFVADLAKEAKDKWFHLDPRGKKYPNIARVESNSFHPVLIGLVRTGWLELSRDKKNKIVIARFVVPHSTLLEWHCYSPRVDDSDVPTDKKVQAAENRRRALEQMLKNDFSAWLTHTTQHQLVSEEKRIKYADLLSIALSGKSPPRKPSPEVRVNGIDSPKEGKVPATSGNGEDETMAKNLHKLKKWLRGGKYCFPATGDGASRRGERAWCAQLGHHARAHRLDPEER